MPKLIWTLSVLLLTSIQLYSQNLNQISVNYGLIESDFIRLTTLAGGGGYSNSNSYQVGLTYTRQIFNSFSIETGINWIQAYVEISSDIPGVESKNEKLDLHSIPILANYTFKNKLFINSGFTIDFQKSDYSYDNQTGIGASLGAGRKFKLKGIFLNINPLIQLHSIIPFQKEKYHQKLIKAGIQFAIGYEF